MLFLQGSQKFGGIGDIFNDIKGLMQGSESVGVVQQVDLHTAYVNVAYSPRLQLPDGGNGLGFRGEVAPLPVDSYRPWPGEAGGGSLKSPPRFDKSHRFEKVRRDAIDPFRSFNSRQTGLDDVRFPRNAPRRFLHKE
jgi:hypothetical protein